MLYVQVNQPKLTEHIMRRNLQRPRCSNAGVTDLCGRVHNSHRVNGSHILMHALVQAADGSWCQHLLLCRAQLQNSCCNRVVYCTWSCRQCPMWAACHQNGHKSEPSLLFQSLYDAACCEAKMGNCTHSGYHLMCTDRQC